jgi:hypothetical protein
MFPIYCLHTVSIISQVVHFRLSEFIFFSEGSTKFMNFFHIYSRCDHTDLRNREVQPSQIKG